MSQSDAEYRILEEQEHGDCMHRCLTIISYNRYYCNKCKKEFQTLPYETNLPLLSYDGFKDTIVIKYDTSSFIIVNDLLSRQCRIMRKTWV